ncbi:sulfur carrier protein ThiS adenylyltransferase ThiF [Veillonella agrestimuris]|uniref:sulfur carrier protein ThiS adenylyltransferase ThiF n=1 Tax=Veillonella agrestimuris TaxID=2941340 RepID=UPI00203B2076|nr:sulfur carrier protein ThiS adenylyltransferase ThiF [Veillonella agrestimuris]
MDDYFEQGLLRFYSPHELRRLQNAVVGICGAGGIGSNCAISLARSGIRHFVIADMDRVEWSNLNRQAYVSHHVGQYKVDALTALLHSINPHITVVAHKERLTRDNLLRYMGDVHILVEAFDVVQSKVDFYEATHDLMIPRIMVSGIAGIGGVAPTQIKQLGENCYIVGDGASGIDRLAPFAPRVAMAANQQADLVLALLLDKEVCHDILP